MTSLRLIILTFSGLLAGCSSLAGLEPRPPAPPVGSQPSISQRSVPLNGSGGQVLGSVTLRQGPSGLLLTIEGQEWPQGWHGVHLHGVGTCETPAFTSAGSHVNHAPAARPHGLMNWDGGPDGGDLPNVYAHADGTARAELLLPVTAASSLADLLDEDGLALVVHVAADDHQSQPIGGAGARMACAVLIAPAVAAED